jgi:hypothetical protein
MPSSYVARPARKRFTKNCCFPLSGLLCGLLLTPILACSGCRRAPTVGYGSGPDHPKARPSASCSASQSKVLPGKSISVQINALDLGAQTVTYQWRASGGALQASGAVARWTAPSGYGAFSIDVTATTASGLQTSCAVLVDVGELATAPPPPQLPSLPIPQLPKLPQWTITYTLPDGLAIGSAQEDLGTIYDRVKDALTHAGIGSDHSSAYAVGTDGFAIVTHAEYIDNNGVPLSPRWSVAPPQKFPTTLSDFWHALITASPGRYRVMVIVVTSRELQSLKNDAQMASPEEMSKLLRKGDDRIPNQLRQVSGTPDRRCVAIIYEFYRPSSSDAPKLVDDTTIGGPEHLSSAGLWPKGELP